MSNGGELMRNYLDILNEQNNQLNEETGGPFETRAAAVANAREEIGGGDEGVNFSIKKKDDGFHWDENVNECE